MLLLRSIPVVGTEHLEFQLKDDLEEWLRSRCSVHERGHGGGASGGRTWAFLIRIAVYLFSLGASSK